MGWSCRKDAADTLEQIQKFFEKRQVIKEHWGSNSIIVVSHTGKDWTGFWERSNVEHEDGAITGTVYKNVGPDLCRKVGSFRIEGHGGITRFPGLTLQEQAYIHTQCPWYVGDYSNPRN